MPETMVDHEYVENYNQDVAVVRHVGHVRNLHVEIWASKARNNIVLVVTPTISGFTIIGEGDPGQLDVFTNVGHAVLQAFAGTLPLVTGDWFGAGAASPRDVQAPRLVRRAEAPKIEAVPS